MTQNNKVPNPTFPATLSESDRQTCQAVFEVFLVVHGDRGLGPEGFHRAMTKKFNFLIAELVSTKPVNFVEAFKAKVKSIEQQMETNAEERWVDHLDSFAEELNAAEGEERKRKRARRPL